MIFIFLAHFGHRSPRHTAPYRPTFRFTIEIGCSESIRPLRQWSRLGRAFLHNRGRSLITWKGSATMPHPKGLGEEGGAHWFRNTRQSPFWTWKGKASEE